MPGKVLCLLKCTSVFQNLCHTIHLILIATQQYFAKMADSAKFQHGQLGKILPRVQQSNTMSWQNFAKWATCGGFGSISPNPPFSPLPAFLDIIGTGTGLTMKEHISQKYLLKKPL